MYEPVFGGQAGVQAEQAAAEVEARTRAAGPCSPDFSPADDDFWPCRKLKQPRKAGSVGGHAHSGGDAQGVGLAVHADSVPAVPQARQIRGLGDVVAAAVDMQTHAVGMVLGCPGRYAVPSALRAKYPCPLNVRLSINGKTIKFFGQSLAHFFTSCCSSTS